MRNFSSFLLCAPFFLRSYVNWIRCCNYGHTYIYIYEYTSIFRRYTANVFVYWWSVFTSKLKECNRFIICCCCCCFFFSPFIAVLSDSFLLKHSTQFHQKIYRSLRKHQFLGGSLDSLCRRSLH